MGFNIKAAELLLKASSLGVSFEKTVTIGRQQLHGSRFYFERLFRKSDCPGTLLNDILKNERYSEDFLKYLGARTIDSIDASNFENASIIHDMNEPISDELKGKYSVVIDGGSLEHVFNFPVAIKSCMELIHEGGHFIGIVPANNFFGHGFYQFSPELFYRVFSEVNGFTLVKMLLFFNDPKSPIYEVSDPLLVQSRVTLKNTRETYLFFVAKRLELRSIFSSTPQQSDYVSQWQETHKLKRRGNRRERITQRIPGFIVFFVLRILSKYNYFKSLLSPIGNGNANYFKKVG